GEWPEGSRKLARIGKIFHTGLRGLSQYDITSGNLGGNGTFGAGILQPMGKSDRISAGTGEVIALPIRVSPDHHAEMACMGYRHVPRLERPVVKIDGHA